MGRIEDFAAGTYLPGVPRRYYESCPRDVQLYLASLHLAMRDAKLSVDATNAARIGLFDGTSRASFDFWYEHVRDGAVATRRALAYATPGQAAGIGAAITGVHGPVYTFSASCSSGSIAVGQALLLLDSNVVDVALVTGHESALSRPIFEMYGDAGLLSGERREPRRAVRPYSGRSGNAFGEGAVTLVLERASHARHRGATPRAFIGGYAYANTGTHPTHVDTEGVWAAGMIRQVLAENALALSDVDFVVGHGNGVRVSDAAEIALMRSLFTDRRTPLLSTKPLFGHTLGAAGTVNIVASVLMIEHGQTVRTPNVGQPAGCSDLAFGPPAGARPPRVGIAVSFGIGGHNTVVLVHQASSTATENGAGS